MALFRRSRGRHRLRDRKDRIILSYRVADRRLSVEDGYGDDDEANSITMKIPALTGLR